MKIFREAVVNAMVFVHQSLYKCNAKIVKRGGHVMSITPRHFLDFIQHFAKLYQVCYLSICLAIFLSCCLCTSVTPRL